MVVVVAQGLVNSTRRLYDGEEMARAQDFLWCNVNDLLVTSSGSLGVYNIIGDEIEKLS